MPHRTFFSFHPERDPFRSRIVSQSLELEESHKTWISASQWEKTKRSGDSAVEQLILNGLKHTSVTAVLIGAETANRRWIQYEIEASRTRGNGLFGIYIHHIKDEDGLTASKGVNPLPSEFPAYDWILDNGYRNLSAWVEAAHHGP